MKRFIPLLCAAIFIFSAAVYGQQKIDVISSAGGFNMSGDATISLTWTLGETIITDFVSGDGTISLAHGFQSKLIITKVETNIINPVTISLYPNPVSTILKIAFEKPLDAEVLISCVNSHGKVVLTTIVGSGISYKEIDLERLPPGMYYLRMQKGIHVNVYRVVKL